MESQPIKLLDCRDEAGVCYTVTLKPGVVRYLSIEDFLGANIEDAISYLRPLLDHPEIEIPYRIRPWLFTEEFKRKWSGLLHQKNWMSLDFEEVNALAVTKDWETQLRLHHTMGRMFLADGMPSWVYRCFHGFLGLKEIAFDECLKAWLKEALGNDDIINSYRKSSDHLIPAYDGEEYVECVFAKTSFVMEKLKSSDRNETEKKTAMELELLRRSSFDCFIYLIEDFRNKAFKIGRSKTPSKRERTLQSEVPQISMRFSIPAGEGHERQLHEHFQNKRLRGEWFTLTNEDLIWIIGFLKTNGDISRAIVDYQWLGNVYFASAATLSNNEKSLS